MKIRLLNSISIVGIFFFFQITLIQANNDAPSIFDKIEEKDIQKATIEVDIDELLENWRSDEKYQAVFSYEDENKKTQIWKVKLQIRGKFRRMHCDGIPPLKIFFEKDDLEEAGLATYNDLKMVNYCTEDKELARELLVKEYLAYKMYRTLTEESFRVKLLKITYQDTKSKRKLKQLVFFIEDTAEMRDRIGANKYELATSIEDISFDTNRIQMMALFQYMIGNTDWETLLEKNLKLVEKNGEVIAIPYDFDFSGLVNPPYGTANSRYNLTNLQERVYLGPTEGNLKSLLIYFNSKHDDFSQIIEADPWLQEETKLKMIAYIDSFYQNLTPMNIVNNIPKESRTRLD